MIEQVTMTSYEDEIDLSDLWKAIQRRKALVLIMTVIPGLLALLVAFLQPKVYVAEASVMPIRFQSDTAEAFAAGVAVQAGPVDALLAGLASTKTPDLVGILNSRALAERVIKAHQLDTTYKQVFGGKGALDTLDQMVTILPPSRANSVTIHVKAPDPQLAALIANGYVTELEGVMQDIAHQRAQKALRSLDAQLVKTKQALAEAEANLGQKQGDAVGGHWFTQQEYAVLQSSYKKLLQQHEAASLAEQKITDDFLPLDEARVPSKPESSKKGIFLGIGLMIGLMLGVATAIFGERATLFPSAAPAFNR
ncbi:MAG TPA: Wzz/FepE/Etk N-terminal domain-containing protein [Stenomitos sp.]